MLCHRKNRGIWRFFLSEFWAQTLFPSHGDCFFFSKPSCCIKLFYRILFESPFYSGPRAQKCRDICLTPKFPHFIIGGNTFFCTNLMVWAISPPQLNIRRKTPPKKCMLLQCHTNLLQGPACPRNVFYGNFIGGWLGFLTSPEVTAFGKLWKGVALVRCP